jgi:proteasome lid subunit RPN8/RPN11
MNGEIIVRTNNFSYLPITQKALEKVKTYAKIADRTECYGFLLSPIGAEDGIVYDAILAPNQEVSSTHAHLDPRAAAQAKQEIENKGYKAIGFWHSHSNFNTFHSGTDDRNMERLLLSLSGNMEEKKKIQVKDGYSIEDNEIVVRRQGIEFKIELSNRDTSFQNKPVKDIYSELVFGMTKNNELFLNLNKLNRLTAKNPKNIKIRENHTETLETIGAAYSLVVNNNGNYYAEIGVTKWCNICEKLDTKINKSVSLNLISVRDDIEFKKSDLEKEAQEKIIGFRKKRKWFR